MNKSSTNMLATALAELEKQHLTGDRAEAVRLAVKAVLVLLSGLHPSLYKGEQQFDPYPKIVKYVRASNAETLGGLIENVLREISQPFLPAREKLAGIAFGDLFVGGEVEKTAVSILKTETTPIVMFTKSLSSRMGDFEETDQTTSEEGKA